MPNEPIGDVTVLLHRWSAGDRRALDEVQGRIVELRYFGGLSVQETAHVLEISRVTVQRKWNTAKAWLERRLGRD